MDRERRRQTRLRSARIAASAAADALRGRYGEGIAVYLFGSTLDPARFRLESDIDLAVRGLPPNRYYEACRMAETAAGTGRLDLIRLEGAADWLVAQVEASGERLA